MTSCFTACHLALAAAVLVAAPATAAHPRQSRAGLPTAQHGDAVRAAIRSATVEPSQRDFINAAAVYAYADNVIYHAYTAPGNVTDITLQPGETLAAVASGDTVRWVIGDTTSGSGAARRVHVLVKPFSAGLSTNLVITTDRRTYHLVLTSSARSAMAALSWSYPHDALLALSETTADVSASQSAVAGPELDRLNFGYRISGDKPDWRPLRAFDDGRKTYIEFPPSLAVGEAPPLFLVDRDGGTSLVNYRVAGRYYVVDRLFDVAELRLGAKHQETVRITRTAKPVDERRRRS